MYRYVLLISFCLIYLSGNSQCNSIPGNILVWHETVQHEECIPLGEWVDKGPDNIKVIKRVGCEESEGHTDSLLSMNFNDALLFDDNGTEYEFRIKNNRAVEVSVFAVLVPRDRKDSSKEEWGLILPEQERVRSLNIDYMKHTSPVLIDQQFDYGDDMGTDLLITSQEEGTYEEEKYGKIVTYQTILRPNRCITSNGIMNEIFQIYSPGHEIQQRGQVPEFLIFNKILTPVERIKVETYLAIKYGISKELHYISCDGDIVWDYKKGEDYGYRITGISNEAEWDLNQSRSNSYYDEDFTARFQGFEEVEDFSHHKNRLLTIGIEDESSDIVNSWAPSNQIWGATDEDLANAEVPGNADFSYINRIWRMEVHNEAGVDANPSIRWLNFVDMKNDGGEFFKKHPDATRIGFCSSSTGLRQEGSFTFTTGEIESANNSIIGFSSDNMNFADSDNVIGYTGFIFGIRLDQDGHEVVYDTDGDGNWDTSEPISISSNEEYTINFRRNNNGTYHFDIESPEFEFDSDYKCSGNGGLFAKMLIGDSGVSFKGFSGEGFEESLIKGTNVEYSIPRVVPVFEEDEDIEKYTPVLLIDRDGEGEFDFAGAEQIRGKYSYTPFGHHDKIEFEGVQWDSDGSIVDQFTLSFIDCPENIVNCHIENCCSDLSSVAFDAKACLESDEVYYQFIELVDGAELLASGYADSEELIELGEYPPGDYLLSVWFQNCDVIEKKIHLEPINVLPDELFAEDEIECIPGIDLFLDASLLFDPVVDLNSVVFDWVLPSGLTIPNAGPVILAGQEGLYVVKATLYCSNGEFCTVTDSIRVFKPCVNETSISTTIEECCDCSTLFLNVESSCFDEAEYFIHFNSNVIQSGILTTGDDTFIDHCFEEGSYLVVVIFEDESFVTTTFVVEQTMDYDDIDLVTNPEFTVNSSDEEICFDTNDFITNLDSYPFSVTLLTIVDESGNTTEYEVVDGEFESDFCLGIGCYELLLDVECPYLGNTCQITDEVCILCDEKSTISVTQSECCGCTDITVLWESNCSDVGTYAICDIDGNIVISENIESNSPIIIDCLRAGSYVVKVRLDDGTYVEQNFEIEEVEDYSNIDLIPLEEYIVTNSDEEICLDPNVFVTNLANYPFSIESLFIIDENGNTVTYDVTDGQFDSEICLGVGCYQFVLNVTCPGSNRTCQISDTVCIVCDENHRLTIGLQECCECTDVTLNWYSTCNNSGDFTITLNGLEIESGEIYNNDPLYIECLTEPGNYNVLIMTSDSEFEQTFTVQNIELPDIDIVDGNLELPVSGELCIDISNAANQLIDFGVVDFTLLVENLDDGFEEVSSNVNELCVDAIGCYNVSFVIRCPNTSSIDTCRITDYFCVTQAPDPCVDIVIVECNNANSRTGEPDCREEIEFCLSGDIPIECTFYSWNIIDEFGQVWASGTNNNLSILTIVIDYLPTGNYTLVINWNDVHCPCEDISTTFFWENGNIDGDIIESNYCLGDVIEIDDRVEVREDWCIRWDYIAPNGQIITIQGGLLADNLVLDNINLQLGNYVVTIYDCNTLECIEQGYFIIDCRPIAERLLVEEYFCSDDYSFKLKYTNENVFEKYLLFEVFRFNNNIPEELVYSAVHQKNEESYIPKLDIGFYWLSTITSAGLKSDVIIEVTGHTYGQESILEERELRLSPGKSMTLDASMNFGDVDAIYLWYLNSKLISERSQLTLSELGRYEVVVEFDDCILADVIDVISSSESRLNSDIEPIAGIALSFTVPLLEGELNQIVISNRDLEDKTYLSIYTIDGQLVENYQFDYIENQKIEVNLRKGVYVIKANNSSNESVIKKMIIL